MDQTRAAGGTGVVAAGLLYLVIIAAGVWSEAFVRAALVASGDADTTAANILAHQGLFRFSLAADALMALCDAGLAVLLFLLLRPHGAALALAATVFRLIQTSIIGGNLMNQIAALSLVTGATGIADAEALALYRLDLHAQGYDVALIFFGVANLLLGVLLCRAPWAAKALGWLIAASGIVYLTGSFLRLLAPELAGAFAYAYALPLLAETAFAVTLLVAGLRGRARLSH